MSMGGGTVSICVVTAPGVPLVVAQQQDECGEFGDSLLLKQCHLEHSLMNGFPGVNDIPVTLINLEKQIDRKNSQFNYGKALASIT